MCIFYIYAYMSMYFLIWHALRFSHSLFTQRNCGTTLCGCPKKLWMFSHWNGSWSGQMGFEQPDLVKSVFTHSRGEGRDDFQTSLAMMPTQTILLLDFEKGRKRKRPSPQKQIGQLLAWGLMSMLNQARDA